MFIGGEQTAREEVGVRHRLCFFVSLAAPVSADEVRLTFPLMKAWPCFSAYIYPPGETPVGGGSLREVGWLRRISLMGRLASNAMFEQCKSQ